MAESAYKRRKGITEARIRFLTEIIQTLVDDKDPVKVAEIKAQWGTKAEIEKAMWKGGYNG